ncbi:MAG: YgiQ family radical SAM protein [Thermodesulfobacteriota bacterium]
MPRTPIPQPDFLPMTRAEMNRLGWDELDVLLVTGDAYVDHPSFGAPLLGRWLVAHGYRTGLAAQPAWEGPESVSAMGRPRLFAGVTAGSLDSMLAHYTAFRKKRSDDAYTPGGKAGARPNRAATVYANLARRAFPGLPVVLGGIEASLRRASHYDFWSDSLRRSILLDAKATAVFYGMAEHSILALAEGLERLDAEGGSLKELLASIPGAVWAGRREDLPPGADILELPSHEAILSEPVNLVAATKLMERHVHQDRQTAVQQSGDRLVILNPPGRGLEGGGLDALYALPFSRRPHPSYKEAIPAASMIEGSLNIHRGCAGGCSFCTLALHQGRRIRSRSRASVMDEARRLSGMRGFSGSVSDVGGPSANMWGGRCAGDMASCKRASCLTPAVCKHFRADQKAFVELLRAVEDIPGVRHVRVASGWRMDLGLQDPKALAVMVREFTGGQAKVAPEHMSARVLKLMRKPAFSVFERFLDVFGRESGRAGKEQYVIPYLMSAHPGCTEADMRDLAGWLRARGWKPSQVQCFIPLPGTMAAAMFFSGTGPDGEPVYVARSDAERLRQHAILMPEHRGEPGSRESARERRSVGAPGGAGAAGKRPRRREDAGDKGGAERGKTRPGGPERRDGPSGPGGRGRGSGGRRRKG